MRTFLIGLLVWLIGISAWASPVPQAVGGVLDLRGWAWDRQGVVHLDGEWEWYWQQLHAPAGFASGTTSRPDGYVSVPDVWNEYVQAAWWEQGQGYATYRLRVLLPKQQKKLAIKMLIASTAVELYANGKQVGGAGKVGRTKDEMTPAYQPFHAALDSVGDTLELVAHVSNFHYRSGGLWTSLSLGTETQVNRLSLRMLVLDFMLAGAFLLMGLYHLAIYLFLRRNLLPLFFGLFCLFTLIRILVTGQYASTVWIDWDWEWLVRVEFLSWFLEGIVFVLFSRQLFPREFSQPVVRRITIGGLCFALLLLLPPLVFTYVVRPFQVYMVVAGGYCLTRYIRAYKRRRTGSLYFLIGCIVFFVCILNDILFSAYIIQTGYFFYIGLFVFVLSQAVTISEQFSAAFSDLEQINLDLGEANEELHQKGGIIYEKNEELLKVNAELDSVVYRISHDLRSPVASVLGLAGLIQDEPNAEVRKQYINLQEKTLHRMDRLIQDIIDYSKNNRTDIAEEPVCFQTLVSHVLEDHSHLEQAKYIQKRIHVEQTQPFMSDPRRLSVVFSNLIANAIRYHNLQQETPFIQVHIQVAHSQAIIEVRDNGQGIGKEHLDKIFQMFYRANEQTKGSGLGLYIVHEAITKLQGSIEVESVVGEGTVFRIRIPETLSSLSESVNSRHLSC